MENSNYLGSEKVGKLLRQFAIPCICSLIISCLYNIVDQIFVGNGVGYLGNAATGVIFPVTVVGWGLSLFFGDGAAAALSVSLGRGETTDIHRSVGNDAVLGSFLSGVAVVVIADLWGDGLLRLIGATDANIQMAHDYGVIIFAMMPPGAPTTEVFPGKNGAIPHGYELCIDASVGEAAAADLICSYVSRIGRK